jgi:hypothetical protein
VRPLVLPDLNGFGHPNLSVAPAGHVSPHLVPAAGLPTIQHHSETLVNHDPEGEVA